MSESGLHLTNDQLDSMTADDLMVHVMTHGSAEVVGEALLARSIQRAEENLKKRIESRKVDKHES